MRNLTVKLAQFFHKNLYCAWGVVVVALVFCVTGVVVAPMLGYTIGATAVAMVMRHGKFM